MKYLLLLSLILLTSCETLTGNFSAYEEILLKDSKGESVKIRDGVYLDSKLKLKSKRKLKLIVDGTTFTFKIPRGTKIPTENGIIDLSSAEVKQPYDILGSINTEVEHGQVQRDSETCEWQEPYTVCRDDSNGRQICRTEYRTRYGHRDIQFHYDLISKDLTVSLSHPGTNDMTARFEGHQRYYQRVVEYEGRCF